MSMADPRKPGNPDNPVVCRGKPRYTSLTGCTYVRDFLQHLLYISKKKFGILGVIQLWSEICGENVKLGVFEIMDQKQYQNIAFIFSQGCVPQASKLCWDNHDLFNLTFNKYPQSAYYVQENIHVVHTRERRIAATNLKQRFTINLVRKCNKTDRISLQGQIWKTYPQVGGKLLSVRWSGVSSKTQTLSRSMKGTWAKGEYSQWSDMYVLKPEEDGAAAQ